MEYAQRNGINAFFFIEELGLSNTPVAIIMTLAGKPNEDVTLSDYIDYDFSVLTKNYPDLVLEEIIEDIEQINSYTIKYYNFTIENRSQVLAYIDSNLKYYIKIYIDILDEENKETYINDFISGCAELTCLNVQFQE